MANKIIATLPLLALVEPTGAAAQSLDTVGSRAVGMAAFVAVADDASAVAWNPAGLLSGPVFNLLIDVGRGTHQPDDPTLSTSAAQIGSTMFAFGTFPVGLAYYRISSTIATPEDPAVPDTPDRQDSHVVVRTLVTNHVGATVQQSLGGHLTLGTTLKLVRGEMGVQRRAVTSWEEALDSSGNIERDGSMRGDLDVGAMANVGRFRAGVVVRNVTEPTFESEDESQSHTLPRHARVGVAWGDRWPGMSSTILAFDADITRVNAIDGERRDVAAGVEHWLARRMIGVRGGVRASTVGDQRWMFSGGGSVALRPGIYVDATYAGGEPGTYSWGVAARVTY